MELVKQTIDSFLKDLFTISMCIELRKVGVNTVIERYYNRRHNNISKMKVCKGRKVMIYLVVYSQSKEKYLLLCELPAAKFNENFNELKGFFDEVLNYANCIVYGRLYDLYK